MSDRIEPFTITVPAATPQSAYAEFPLAFRDGRVDRLEIKVPPGSSGLMGFRLAHSGQSVIPYTGNEWIITDDENLDWDLDNYPTGGMWQAWAYNTDVYDHTIHFRFHVTEIATALPVAGTALDIQPVGTAEDVGEEIDLDLPIPVDGGIDDSAN